MNAKRLALYLVAILVAFAFVMTSSANALEAKYKQAIEKWVEEFQPSALSKEEQIKELTWFAEAAEPYRGMKVKSCAEHIQTHLYESEVLAKAFSEITGIDVEHDVIGEGDVVERMQTHMASDTVIYHAYVNDADIAKAVEGTRRAFAQNIFPAMKVRWEHYPDHIGHQTSPGCFRCHDGLHASEDGQYISHDCEDCHAITAQGKMGEMQFSTTTAGLDFQHPVDIDEAWIEMPCYECHSTPPVGF